jgi:glycine/D-amino acid oxidase-like deaminating enzyme
MTLPPHAPRRLVILGGGTAGWIAANLFAKHWGALGVAVTLVESPDVGIIGVGEGSTPQLRAFFAEMDIAEADWMPRCNATYKGGIRFNGWSNRPGFDSYYHPFPTPLDVHTAPIFFHMTRLMRAAQRTPSHPDRYFPLARIADEARAPVAPPQFPFDLDYGYHFDAYLVGAMLRDAAKARGVAHAERHVGDVEMTGDGRIAALLCNDGERIEGEFFVDCSGFAAALIEKKLGVPHISFGETLFNDRAVVMPTPHGEGPLNAHTTATALSAGWVWDIPLTTRTGNGYVYASTFISPDAAEAELRAHLGVDESVGARHLQMKVGRVARSWESNCLAVGLAQGFIEPLEATALHIVLATVQSFIASFAEGDYTPQHRDAFNARIGARYDGIRDYIVCHYRVNQRRDNDYWRANAENQAISDVLKAMLTCWYTAGDLTAEIERLGIGGYYGALSWHCLFAGYGVFPAEEQLRDVNGPLADMAAIDDFVRRCAGNFPDHAALLRAGTPLS